MSTIQLPRVVGLEETKMRPVAVRSILGVDKRLVVAELLFGDTNLMSKRFTISMGVCVAIFILLNAVRLLTGLAASVGVSGWRTTGAPFPVNVESFQCPTAGPVVTVIKDQSWIWASNVGFWLLLSYGFSRWVDRKGAD
jgi:hypothetical protein